MGEIYRGFESNYLRIDLCCIHAKTACLRGYGCVQGQSPKKP